MDLSLAISRGLCWWIRQRSKGLLLGTAVVVVWPPHNIGQMGLLLRSLVVRGPLLLLAVAPLLGRGLLPLLAVAPLLARGLLLLFAVAPLDGSQGLLLWTVVVVV